MLSPRRLRKRQVGLFKPIKFFDPKEFLANAGIGRTMHQYGRKQAIFSQGKPADAVYYIQEGRVRLSVVSKQGKEATIALLGPGDFLGEGCIASDQSVRMATATAITECAVLKIEKKEMLRTLHEEHKFSDLFVAYVVQRHKRKTAGTGPFIAGQLREKRQARGSDPRRESGDSGGNDWDNPLTREFLHEQIQETRIH